MTRLFTSFTLVSCLLASLAVAQVTDSTAQAEQKRGLVSRLFKARDKPLTNAQRLSRGLPPQKPKRLYQGSRRLAEADVYVRATPLTGALAVSSPDGTALGYVSSSSGTPGLYNLVTDSTSALIVTITPSSGPTDITTLNGFADYPQLGAIQGIFSSTAFLETGLSNYVFISGTGHTDPGSYPEDVGNAYSADTGNDEPSESSIWFIDPTTKVFSYTYVNPPNTSNDTTTLQLMYYPPSQNFALTGDEAAYEAAYGGYPVVFTLDTSITLP